MRQMFTETYKYNSPDSEIVTAAGKLQKEFEVRFAKMNFQDRKPGKLVSITSMVSPTLFGGFRTVIVDEPFIEISKLKGVRLKEYALKPRKYRKIFFQMFFSYFSATRSLASKPK